jgi:hypothetical protein
MELVKSWPLGSDLVVKVQGKIDVHIFLGVTACLC